MAGFKSLFFFFFSFLRILYFAYLYLYIRSALIYTDGRVIIIIFSFLLSFFPSFSSLYTHTFVVHRLWFFSLLLILSFCVCCVCWFWCCRVLDGWNAGDAGRENKPLKNAHLDAAHWINERSELHQLEKEIKIKKKEMAPWWKSRSKKER